MVYIKINNNALAYIKENNIDYLLIKSTMDIEMTGCACSGGTNAFISPVIETGTGTFDPEDSFILKDVDGIKVYVGKSFISKITEDSEIVLKHHLLGKKLELINYEKDMINKI